MTSRRRRTVLSVIGVAVATVLALSGCTPTPVLRSSDLVGRWVSESGSSIRLTSDGQARFTDFPRRALRLNTVGAPLSGTASWRTVKNRHDGNLVVFVVRDLRFSEAPGASWTATLTDESPRTLVFALSHPGLNTGKDLVLQRNEAPRAR